MKYGTEFVVVAVIVCLACFLYWNNKSIVTTEYVYEGEKVPAAFDGYRIVQVSDLQSEYFGKNQKQLLEKVASAKPDLIVITGDLLDRNHTDFGAARIAVGGLLEIAPVCYVNGNHEMAVDEARMDAFYGEMEAMGVEMVLDRSIAIEKGEERIHVMGLSEHTIFACKNYVRSNRAPLDMDMLHEGLSQLRTKASKEEMTILLAHEPQYLEAYGEEGFDLIFAGHAHGGQIRLPFTDGLYAPGQGVLPKMTSGVHREKQSTLIISRGLGNSTFPYRVFNRPEVVCTILKNGNN